MPFNEIKKLRQAGKLDEALEMALKELEEAKQTIELEVVDVDGNPLDNAAPAANLIWAKRALSWVYYDFLKKYTTENNFDEFKNYLNKIKELQLPEDDKMLFDSCAWQIGKMVFTFYTSDGNNSWIASPKLTEIFDIIRNFHFTKPAESYTFLLKAFQKSHTVWHKYIEFIEWWGINNLRAEDFVKEEFNGRKIMSIGEQLYIAYSKNLVEGQSTSLIDTTRIVDTEKIKNFIPVIDEWIDKYPEFQYLPYNKAKLLLKLGSEENALSAFLPFAKQKRNDFWVWELMAEMFSNDKEMQFACYCKALSLNTQEDYLIKLRQKIAGILIEKNFYDEAKTEIEKIVETRVSHEWKIPPDIIKWQEQPWYVSATAKKHNKDLYMLHADKADEILFQDVKEEVVVVEFVNEAKQILNFVIDKNKSGFFKYDRFIRKPRIGDMLLVRFSNNNGDLYKVLSLRRADNNTETQAKKSMKGALKISSPQNFGFVDNCFVDSKLIEKHKLQDGQQVSCEAILSFNKKKNDWGWKVYSIKPST